MAKDKIKEFRALVWRHARKHGRHGLPWRETKDPYKILVSEVMLQQTQVRRVTPFYKKFMRQFPTAKVLAHAPLSRVLKTWQGLGYNRRAKMLRAAAQDISLGKRISESLPGVGPYTARAVEAFAFNKNVVFVETNIRTAIIHHFFRRRKRVGDTELVEVLKRVLPKGKARLWYSALMDYGASLKRSGVSHNERSRHYTKQSRFAGSLREARGAILRKLAFGSVSPSELAGLFGHERRPQMRTALRNLFNERLIEKRGENYSLAR